MGKAKWWQQSRRCRDVGSRTDFLAARDDHHRTEFCNVLPGGANEHGGFQHNLINGSTVDNNLNKYHATTNNNVNDDHHCTSRHDDCSPGDDRWSSRSVLNGRWRDARAV